MDFSADFSLPHWEAFPRKERKREGRLRRGAAFVAIRADGYVLVRRRAARACSAG